jgi:hypothetical protein
MIDKLFHQFMQKDDRISWRKHVSMIMALRRWQRDVEKFPVLYESRGDVTAYVANFLRPQNIPLIVRSLLACPSVGRIIVSNNNPDCRLEEWFQPDSDRVTVLRHAESQSCSKRYLHLQAFPSAFYLILDDDVFLLPPQIEQLLAALHADPSAPHGLYGQRWMGENFRGGMQQIETSIDVISRIYAFTDMHLQEIFRIADAVGHPADSEYWNVSQFDDMFLSFSGMNKPRIHNVGPFTDCPTQGKKGTATWRRDGFHRGREEMYQHLSALKPLSA